MVEDIIIYGIGGITLLIFIFQVITSIRIIKLRDKLDEITFDVEELYRTTHSPKTLSITERPEPSGIDLEKTYSKPELERAFKKRSNEIADEVEKLKQVEKLLKKWR